MSASNKILLHVSLILCLLLKAEIRCYAIGTDLSESSSGTSFAVAFPPTEGTPFVWRIGANGYSEQTFPDAQSIAIIQSDSAITLVAGRRMANGSVSDLSSVLPISSLADEYRVQGNWFTVVAVEDGTRIDFDTLSSPILNAGDFFTFRSDTTDLSGMAVYSRYGQAIALFNGYDELYEQALPTKYWSNRYAVTATKGKATDIIGVQALADRTTIYINDSAVYTFDFARDGHYYWKFAYGDELEPDSTQFSFSECVLSTSCPAIVHRFTVDSVHLTDTDTIRLRAMNRLTAIDRGTPEVNFVLPTVELAIDESVSQFVNIVTHIDNVLDIRLAINGRDTLLNWNMFNQLGGSSTLSATRVQLPNSSQLQYLRLYSKNGSEHTILATIYATGQSEYRYTGFEAIAPFRHEVYINDSLVTAEMESTPICTDGPVSFQVGTNYPVQRFSWDFGDGSPILHGVDEASHTYTQGGVYPISVIIERDPSAVCAGIAIIDTVHLTVRYDHYRFSRDSVLFACNDPGEPMHVSVYYSDEDSVGVIGNPMVSVMFDDAAHEAGFDERQHLLVYPDRFLITLPDPLPLNTNFGVTMAVDAPCHSQDTTFYFRLDLDPRHMMIQRYDYLLALDPELLTYGDVFDIYWQRDSVYLTGENTTVLNRYNEDRTGAYRVCFVQNGTRHCSCYQRIEPSELQPNFDNESTLTTTSAPAGSSLFINTSERSHADWYTIGGLLWSGNHTILAGGGIIDTPERAGLYILRISGFSGQRNYKILIY